MRNITVTVTGLPDIMSDLLIPDLFARLAKQAIQCNASRIIINLQYGERRHTMSKPIELINIFDLRDETDSMAAVILASKGDFQVFNGLLEAGEPEAYGGWRLAETGPDGWAAPEGLRYYYLYFDVDLSFLTETAIEVVRVILNKYL